MALWLAVAALSLLTVLLVAAPLVRRVREGGSRQEADLRVYRAQLAEVDRDVERGLLAAGEAEAARTEVKRRMLARAGDGGEGSAAASTGATWRLAAGLLGVAAPVAALGLYLAVGAPGQMDRPLVERIGGGAQAVDQDMSAEEAVAALARALQSRPDDVEGWGLLGRSYLGMGRYAEAAEALGRAHRLAPERVEIAAAYGEAQVAAAEGVVSDEAKAVFEDVLALDPREPRSRFYLGLAKAQSGDVRGALQDWVDLAALSPAEAPWLPSLREQIARAAGELGAEIASLEPSAEARALGAASSLPVAPQLAPGEAEAIEQMSDEERERMIRGMVERLASRLEASPNDRDGWLRLARAYEVLGEVEKAGEARARADALAP